MKRKKFIIASATIYIILCISSSLATAQTPNLFVTRIGSEPDKGASAWLIKRFINPNAQIVQRSEHAALDDGIAFDAPEAKYRRTHQYSVYEILLQDYKVSDPIAIYIGRIIHDIEINTWQKKVVNETHFVEQRIRQIRHYFGKEPVTLSCYIAFFDSVYNDIKKDKMTEEKFILPTQCTHDS